MSCRYPAVLASIKLGHIFGDIGESLYDLAKSMLGPAFAMAGVGFGFRNLTTDRRRTDSRMRQMSWTGFSKIWLDLVPPLL